MTNKKAADRGVEGTLNLYPTPAGHEDPVPHPEVHTTGVLREAREDRQNLLRRIFTDVEPAAQQARREVAALFEHGEDGEYESRTPLLQMGKEAEDPQPTLAERTRRVFGRR